jgi:hypothetical protein
MLSDLPDFFDMLLMYFFREVSASAATPEAGFILLFLRFVKVSIMNLVRELQSSNLKMRRGKSDFLRSAYLIASGDIDF